MYGRESSRRSEVRKISGRAVFGLVGVVIVILMFIFWRGLGPIHVIIYGFYSNPLAWISFTIAAVAVIVAVIGMINFEDWFIRSLLIALIATAFWIYWVTVDGPLMMAGLYQDTDYQTAEQLVQVIEPRPVSYAEARTNFRNQNPEARFGPGDLDYVRGEWLAEFGPSTIWNRLAAPTQGFFVYKPQEQDKVQIIRQEMPFAESGWLWNSASYFIHQKDLFVEFHEILYIEDPDGGYMAMVSLIKRSGWRRVPYVSRILLIHADGETEWLSPRQAKEDERLHGIQLTPEWLARKKVEAYGWQNGIWEGMVAKKGRIQVQKSEVNKENSAPYHLETSDGAMWYTPFGPLGKESLKGIMMQDSHDVTEPVLVWKLPGDQAYQGVDALATEIKAAPNHPGDINWLRISRVEGGSARSGDTDIIEMLPVPRLEGDRIVLYFMGYVAIDPPVNTRFYAIINAETREVLEDVFSINEVTSWLNGSSEFSVQAEKTGVSQESSYDVEPSDDLSGMSEEEILHLLKQIAEELERRSEQ